MKPLIASNDDVISKETSSESDIMSTPSSSNNNDDFDEIEITKIPPIPIDLNNLCTGFKIFSKSEFYSL